jgi:hypothetical protein
MKLTVQFFLQVLLLLLALIFLAVIVWTVLVLMNNKGLIRPSA